MEKRLSIPKVSIRQIKAGRALLGWSQDDLANKSNVSLPTIKRLEAAEDILGGREDTINKILNAMAEAGLSFIEENGGGAGVRITK
ncbi:MAG: multiprotein-bridging factor 1 family protein [Xanthobacteraceae bacterium]